MQPQSYSAQDAYDTLAPAYDEVNAQNDYEMWLGQVLLPELEKRGLRTGRVLDVGCGTGKAFEPLRRRGWNYWGCDLSPGMLRMARAKARTRQEGHVPAGVFFEADARELAYFSHRFDLVLLLNDVVNYLVEDGDLERCFAGVARCLAPHGLVCFDTNSLAVYQQDWLSGSGDAMSERGWNWEGLTESAEPGAVFEAEVGASGVEPHTHRQRHWPRGSVEAGMASAGLRCICVLGQRGEGLELVLDEEPDEALHHKLIYVGAHHD